MSKRFLQCDLPKGERIQNLGRPAYLFNGSTVVFDKKHVANAKDEEFQEIMAFINASTRRNVSENRRLHKKHNIKRRNRGGDRV